MDLPGSVSFHRSDYTSRQSYEKKASWPHSHNHLLHGASSSSYSFDPGAISSPSTTDAALPMELAQQMIENVLKEIYGDFTRVPTHIREALVQAAQDGTLTLDKGAEIIQTAEADAAETATVGKNGIEEKVEGNGVTGADEDIALEIREESLHHAEVEHTKILIKKKKNRLAKAQLDSLKLTELKKQAYAPDSSEIRLHVADSIIQDRISTEENLKHRKPRSLNSLHSLREEEGALRTGIEASYS